MPMNHPDLAQLWEYLEGPQASDQAATLDHLIDCAHCRTRVARLTTLQNRVQQQLPQLRAMEGSEADALEIARWVDGAAGISHDPRLKNPAWLKAALHYAVHRSALQCDLPQAQTPPRAAPAASGLSFLQRMTQLFTWRLPLWIPAATAAALAWATLGLPLLTTDQGSAHMLPLATYQDAPVMHFRPAAAQPGMGFFAAANSVERPFTGVQVTRPQARTLELRWPPVENATEYRVTLYRVTNQRSEVVAQQTPASAHAVFNDFDFTANRRYEWEISGSTRDGSTFSANGGFAIP